LEPANATVYTDYPATIQGIQNVEIRPKIDGYVDGIYVDEGATVRKGQLLFRISAPQYEENVRTAEANIKIAVADVNAAQMQVNKVEPLVKQDIISHFELESAQYTLEAKRAALAQANAALNNARINLSYTTISSPVDGVIGILPYKIGSLISGTTAQPLTTVSNITSIYAYFSINEKQGLDFFLASKGGTMQQKLAALPPVKLVLANGTVFPFDGKVETASGLINAETGAVNMRATFSNPDGLVRSGSSAVVRMSQQIDTALLIPQKATYQIQGKLFAYVVDKDNKVNSVEVNTGNTYRNYYVVTGGVKRGDRVVADGISNLREGLTIKPQVYVDSTLNKGN
jgi:membrane fusion protein (multidrug efflux system)